MGDYSLAKNFSPNCRPKPKSLGFKKKLSLGVRSPCSVKCEKTQMQRLETKNYKTTLDCAKKIMVKEVLKEFYTGTFQDWLDLYLMLGLHSWCMTA